MCRKPPVHIHSLVTIIIIIILQIVREDEDAPGGEM